MLNSPPSQLTRTYPQLPGGPQASETPPTGMPPCCLPWCKPSNPALAEDFAQDMILFMENHGRVNAVTFHAFSRV